MNPKQLLHRLAQTAEDGDDKINVFHVVRGRCIGGYLSVI